MLAIYKFEKISKRVLTNKWGNDNIIKSLVRHNKIAMERYRSGHNGAVLKTVCLHGRMGSNPILSAKAVHQVWMAFYLPKVLACIMHNMKSQIVLARELNIQYIVVFKKYDNFLKKFLTNRFGNDILNKLSARKADNDNEVLW